MEQLVLFLPWLGVMAMGLIMAGMGGHFNPPHKFPKGHIHEYDPTGEYTYKYQNPLFKESS